MPSSDVPSTLVGTAITLVLVLSSCGQQEMKVIDKQMDELIKKELPIGASKSKVIAFVDSINLDSLKVINYGYHIGKPDGTDGLEGRQNEVTGYLVAGIPKVGSNPRQLQVYNMRILFYFGEGDRLISHKIETRGDW